MNQQGFLTEQVEERAGIVYTATGTSALKTPIYDLGALGARGIAFSTVIATINAGNFVQAYGSNTRPSDGTFAAGQYTGATALTTTIAGSKTQGAANGDLLRLDIENCPYQFVQFEIVRAGATTVAESSRTFLYNASRLPYTVQSTTTHKRLNAPVLGTA